MRLRPLYNRIVVQPVEGESVSPGGILIPDNAKEKPLEAVVLAAGPGKALEDGSIRPMPVEVGDRVLYSRFAGTELELDGKKLLMLTDDDLMGKLKEKEIPEETVARLLKDLDGAVFRLTQDAQKNAWVVIRDAAQKNVDRLSEGVL